MLTALTNIARLGASVVLARASERLETAATRLAEGVLGDEACVVDGDIRYSVEGDDDEWFPWSGRSVRERGIVGALFDVAIERWQRTVDRALGGDS